MDDPDEDRCRWAAVVRFLIGLLIFNAIAWTLAICITITASPARGETIRNDGGGNVRDYTIQANLAVLRGETIVIDGWCASACVMLLRAGCVTPRAVLAFHSPAGGTRADIERARKTLARHMPRAMGDWYLKGSANHRAVVTIDAATAIEMGATPCSK